MDHTLQVLMKGITRCINDFVKSWQILLIVLKLSWLCARHGGVGTERSYSSTDCNPDITRRYWSASPAKILPGERALNSSWTEGLIGPRGGFWFFEKRKISFLLAFDFCARLLPRSFAYQERTLWNAYRSEKYVLDKIRRKNCIARRKKKDGVELCI